MSTELIKCEDYGIEQTKAGQLAAFFNPVLERCADLEIETNLLDAEIGEDGLTKKTCKKAKTIRMKYVRERTETAKIHKEQKAGVRQIGLFLDGWKNAQLLACQGQEKKLKKIEDYFLNLEKERLEAERKKQEVIQESRAVELDKYGAFVPAEAHTMSDVIWQGYLKGVRLSFENDRLLEKQATEQREKLERENEVIRLETERISELEKLRRHQTSKLINYIVDYDDLIFAEMSDEVYKNLCEVAIKKRTEETERLEKIEAENERLIIKAERVEKERLEFERIEKAKNDAKLAELEAERLRLKKDLEIRERAEIERIAKVENERHAGLNKCDMDRLKDLIYDFWNIQNKFVFESESNKTMFASVKTQIDEIINFIEGSVK